MPESLSVIIPALNEAMYIGTLVQQITQTLNQHEHEIIVVNDGSSDNTKQHAEAAGAKVISHSRSRGYGASLKTGIRHAQYEWIITIDGDGQHHPQDILRLVEKQKEGFDMVIGARDKNSFQYRSRMPGKKFLQWFTGFLVGEKPEDVNSGLRLFRKEIALSYYSLLPNGFSFSTTLTLAMLKDAYLIGSVPIQTEARKTGKSTVSLWQDGFRTLLLIIRVAALFNPLKVFIPISLLFFCTGFLYMALNLLREFNIPDGAQLLMVVGVIIFFFGVLADQFSSIRRGP